MVKRDVEKKVQQSIVHLYTTRISVQCSNVSQIYCLGICSLAGFSGQNYSCHSDQVRNIQGGTLQQTFVYFISPRAKPCVVQSQPSRLHHVVYSILAVELPKPMSTKTSRWSDWSVTLDKVKMAQFKWRGTNHGIFQQSYIPRNIVMNPFPQSTDEGRPHFPIFPETQCKSMNKGLVFVS